MKLTTIAVPILACILVASVCEGKRKKKSEVIEIKEPQQTLTEADVRSIQVTKVRPGSIPGRVVPDYITCAEPSPDIAKALATSLSLGGGLTVNKGAEANAELSFALGRARAETVAQLTTRLATIQLLRDGLYRACEAYANGAISDTTYAVLLSRYDDTMVTMLLGEFVAGTVANEAAIAKAEATADIVATMGQPTSTGNPTREDKGEDKNSEAEETPGEEKEESGATASKELSSVPGSQRVETKSRSSTELTPQRSVATSRTKEVAETLERMQKTFLHNINSDAIVVACLSALGNGTSTPDLLTALATVKTTAQQLAAGDEKDGTLQTAFEAALTGLEKAARSANLSTLASYCLTSDILGEATRAQSLNLRRLFVASHIETMLDTVLTTLGDEVLTNDDAGAALLDLLKHMESPMCGDGDCSTALLEKIPKAP